jgi:hypothetical protein
MGLISRDPFAEPIVALKGFLDDATFTTDFDFKLNKYNHSPSWFSQKEVKKLLKYCKKEEKKGIINDFGYLFGFYWDEELPKHLEKIEDFRFVFWFDS